MSNYSNVLILILNCEVKNVVVRRAFEFNFTQCNMTDDEFEVGITGWRLGIFPTHIRNNPVYMFHLHDWSTTEAPEWHSRNGNNIQFGGTTIPAVTQLTSFDNM